MRYAAFGWAEWRTRLAYRAGTPMAVVLSVFTVYAMQAIWKALYRSPHVVLVGGVAASGAVSYMVLTRLVALIMDDTWTLRLMIGDIRRGDVVTKLARPVDLQGLLFAHTAGRHLHTFLFQILPTIAVSFLFVRIGAPREPLRFVLSLAAGYMLSFGIQFCVGALTFCWTEVMGFATFIRVLGNLASGAFVPLWVLPHGVATVLNLLPFAGMYSTPLDFYIGQVHGPGALWGVALQLGWAAALWVGGRVLYQLGRQRAAYAGG